MNSHNAPTMYNNPNLLQIHPLVISIDADGEEGLDNDGGSNHQGEDFSDSDGEGIRQ